MFIKTPFLNKTARLAVALAPMTLLAGATMLLTGGAPKPATVKALAAIFAPITDLGGHVYDGLTIANHKATVLVFLSTQCPGVQSLCAAFGCAGAGVWGARRADGWRLFQHAGRPGGSGGVRP